LIKSENFLSKDENFLKFLKEFWERWKFSERKRRKWKKAFRNEWEVYIV